MCRPRSDFAGRYGFRGKPTYLRFRVPGGRFSELTVRTDELPAPPDGVRQVYVVENETTYLAFPLGPGAMVVFGGGYAVSTLRHAPWLAGIRLAYWGDLDTHGFAMLPGGFGTMDETFELLTLVQTGKTQPVPIVLLDMPGGTFWMVVFFVPPMRVSCGASSGSSA